jgi:hypothetical protein
LIVFTTSCQDGRELMSVHQLRSDVNNYNTEIDITEGNGSSPSDMGELGFVLEQGDSCRHESCTGRKMEEIRQRDIITREVLVLRKDRFVTNELGLQIGLKSSHERFVSLHPSHWGGDALETDVSCRIVEVGELDGGGDLKSRHFGQVAGREEW